MNSFLIYENLLQVQLLGNLKKHYIGSISSEEKAAKIYDRHAILTHGLRAKTNFSYTKAQIIAILDKENEDPAFDESIGESSHKEQNTNDEDYALTMNIISKTIEIPRLDENNKLEDDIIKS